MHLNDSRIFDMYIARIVAQLAVLDTGQQLTAQVEHYKLANFMAYYQIHSTIHLNTAHPFRINGRMPLHV